MNQSSKNYLQAKVNGGQQKVLVSESLTGETDELDSKFSKLSNAKVKIDSVQDFGDQKNGDKYTKLK